MKKIRRIIPKEPHKIIRWCFAFSVLIILLYELYFTTIPAPSFTIYKLGLVISRILYSIIAASTFYYFSVYLPVFLPRSERKIKILSIIYYKTILIDVLIENLKYDLQTGKSDFIDWKKFEGQLAAINSDQPIAGFENWHRYLFHFRNKLMELISSITIYNDFLTTEFLHELNLMEMQLFKPHTFEGRKTLATNNLRHSALTIQELFVHNKILQELRDSEFKKIEKEYLSLGEEYRERNYKKSSTS